MRRGMGQRPSDEPTRWWRAARERGVLVPEDARVTGDGALTQSQWKTGNAAARAGVANDTGLAEAECDV
jgi:hypothetical protein